MSFELYYTSAPRGLKRTSSGFCTVGATENMPAALQARLESLSSFPSACAAVEEQTPNGAAMYAHWKLDVGGRPHSILSRISPCGLDYSRRPNTLAYHRVLPPGEQPPAGPAWTMLQPGVMQTQWTGEPRRLPPAEAPPMDDAPPHPCRIWESITGDAGWAGVLAQACAARPAQPAHLIYPAGLDLLPLLEEAIALLPSAVRWNVTFSTCFTSLPAGLGCTIRCVAADSILARKLVKQPAAGLVLNLTQPLPPAPQGEAAMAAREGSLIHVSPTSSISAVKSPHPHA